MGDYPPEALFAAAAVIDRMLMALPCYAEFHPDSDVEMAKAALDAAAPLLAEAVAQRILAHMEANGIGMEVQLPGDAAVRRAMRRSHFRIAALDDALALAREHAPHVRINGITALELAERHRA